MTTEKGGKPLIVLTDEQIKEIADLAAYLTVEQTAAYFGIAERTFYDIVNRQPEVYAEYQKGKIRKICRYAKVIEDKALIAGDDRDLSATIFFLKTRARWAEAKEPEKPFEVIERTSEELEAERQEIKEYNEFKKWRKAKELSA